MPCRIVARACRARLLVPSGALLMACAAALCSCGAGAPVAEPTSSPADTATAAPTGEPVATPTPLPTPTPLATPTPSPPPSETPGPTATRAPTPTQVPTTAPTPSATAVPTPTPRPTQPPTQPAIVVTRGTTQLRRVALTFDAGSDRGSAAEILDYLAAKAIPASFGMTGLWALDNPDLVARMVDEGHVLINHTYDHPHMETLDTAKRLDQLARAESAVQTITGSTMVPWFRPPYGAYNTQVLVDVATAGYHYAVMWTVDSLGWQGLDPALVTQRCLEGAVNGAIYLMHVGALSTDWEALPGIVEGLRAGGYQFVTVPEVIR